jgi:hypothetical protein
MTNDQFPNFETRPGQEYQDKPQPAIHRLETKVEHCYEKGQGQGDSPVQRRVAQRAKAAQQGRQAGVLAALVQPQQPQAQAEPVAQGVGQQRFMTQEGRRQEGKEGSDERGGEQARGILGGAR